MEIISYEQLLEMYENSVYIPYQEYLRTNEWFEKRKEVLSRDNFTCQSCLKQATMTHYDDKTHKNYYLWFGDDQLITWADLSYDYIPKVTIADKPYHLEIHHKFYLENRLPWDYDDSDLITYCNWCHENYHKHNDVEFYTTDKSHKIKLSACKRCNGIGFFKEYTHVKNGVCFECNGNKFNKILITNANKKK